MEADRMCSTKPVPGIMAPSTDGERTIKLLLKITCLAVVLRLARGGLELELEEHLQLVLDRMRRDYQLVIEDFENVAEEDEEEEDDDDAENLPPVISRNVKRLDLLNPDIQLVYDMISSKFSSTIISMTRTILESFLENLSFFVWGIEEQMIIIGDHDLNEDLDLEAAQSCLRFLGDFLRYTSKRCTELEKLKDLVNHAQLVVGNLTCLLFLRSAHTNTNMMISDVLKKFSPAQPEVREIYIKALKGDNIPAVSLVDTVDWDFLYSLGDYILEHPEMKLINYSMGSDEDHHQILNMYVHRELLILLLSYLVYKSSEAENVLHMEPKPDQIYKYFLKHISFAIADMGFLAFSLHHHGEQSTVKAEELKVASSHLQDFIRIANQEARNAYAAYIPKSWRLKTKCSIIDDEETMLHSLTEKFESFLDKKDRKTASITGHLRRVYKKELESLIEAFKEYLITKQQQHLDQGKQEIAQMMMTCINHIRVHEIFLFETEFPQQLWFLHLIEQIRMVKMEMKELQNQMMHCGGSNSQGRTEGIHDCTAIFENETQLPTTARTREIVEADGTCSTKPVRGIMAPAFEVDDSDLESLSEVFKWTYRGREAHILRLKITCLVVVLRVARELELEEHLQLVLDHMSRVFRLVILDLQNVSDDDDDDEEDEDDHHLLPVICRNVERLDLLNPDIHLVYSMISSKFSATIIFMTRTILKSFLKTLDFFLRYTEVQIEDSDEDLKKEDLDAAQRCLTVLRDFLRYTSERCAELEKLKDLVNHAQLVVGNLSCLLYLGSAHTNTNMMISDVFKKFSPAQPEVRDNYIKALKGDNTPAVSLVDRVDLDFLFSLRDYTLKQPEMSLTNYSMGSDKDNHQILNMYLQLQQEVLFFLISYLVYKSLEAQYSAIGIVLHMEPKPDQIYNYFLKHISSAIADMGFLAFSLHHPSEQSTDKAKELKVAFSDLQNFIKNAKEEARNAYAAYIPKSWRLKTKFLIIDDEETILRSLRKRFEFFQMGFWKESITWHLRGVYKKELQSLIEAFKEYLITKKQQHLDHGKQETAQMMMTCINQTTGDAFTFVRNPEQSVEDLWLLHLIEQIRMVKMELKELQNQMMHCAGCNSQGKTEGTHDCAAIFENEAQLSTTHEIEIQRNNLDLVYPIKDEVKALIFKASSLKVVLSCQGMLDIEDGNLKPLLTHIRNVFQSVEQDLQRLFPDLNIQSLLDNNVQGFPMNVNVDCLPFEVLLSRFQLLETDMQAVHHFITTKSSTRFITRISDEGLEEYLNIVLKNVDVLRKCITELPSPLKEELEDVVKSLRFLRNFLGFIGKRCSSLGILKDLLIRSEQLVANVSSLLYLCCESEKVNDQRMNDIKVLSSSELRKFCPTQIDIREIYVKALEASMSAKENSDSVVQVLDEYILGFLDSCDHILELSHNNSNLVNSVKELLKEMKFIITFFTMGRSLDEHPKHDQTLNSLYGYINVVITDIGCLTFMLNDNGNNEDRAQELNRRFLNLAAKIVVVKEDIRKIYDSYFPTQFQSDFPRTNGQGFLGSLFQKLNELLNAKPNSVAPIKHHIEIVQKKLLSLRENFGEVAKQLEQCDYIHAQWVHFLCIAYETELIIDLYLVGGNPICYHLLGFFKVTEEMKKIQAELKAIKIKIADENPMQRPSEFSVKSYSSESNFVFSSKEGLANERSMIKPVILREEEGKIREQLIRTSQDKLKIISIVGMPGIGKTTLADKVFQDSFDNHFQKKARCCISQFYDKGRLLLGILKQVTTEPILKDDYGDLSHKLNKNLKGRRYLILMDDVWNIQLWRDIKSCFPDDENGSRIIFTTRFEKISDQTGLESINCPLSPLSEEKSWEMLKVILFENKSPPPELERFGKRIASNCKGLPLAIDLVAGILRVKERNEWNEVENKLMARLLEHPEGNCRKVVELSYQDLPDDMKACFLYFSAFPEDANVQTRDLILFWIGEGFIQSGNDDELKTLEDAAEDILNNLISRSLVTVSERGPLGGVSASRVHDLLHEFAITKAREERFMERIIFKEGCGELDGGGKSYRMCINPQDWERFIELNPSGFRTRALIFTTLNLYTFKFNGDSFKLLKILYIPSIGSTQVFKLIHLRVLIIGRVEELEKNIFVSKIHKLHNLESFQIVEGIDLNPDLCLLLDKICNMVRLRHLDFSIAICFRYRSEKFWEMSSLLNNLQTLRSVAFRDGEDAERILKLMPNLVELKVEFYIRSDGGYVSPKLDCLEKLESLNVRYRNTFAIYDYISPKLDCLVIGHLPKNLKNLVLIEFISHWTDITEIGNLEHLEALELYGIVKGPKWDMIDGQFPKLKYLKLSCLELEEWNATAENLSCLQKLHLDCLEKLKMLPSCLAEIPTLDEITLNRCFESRNSAKRIKEEQEEAGNDQLMLNYLNVILW